MGIGRWRKRLDVGDSPRATPAAMTGQNARGIRPRPPPTARDSQAAFPALVNCSDRTDDGAGEVSSPAEPADLPPGKHGEQLGQLHSDKPQRGGPVVVG